MLRLIPLAILLTIAAPSYAAEPSEGPVVAQQQQAPQQTPRRNCEKKKDEGVSS
jgi:hypothetical protein